MSRPRLTRKVAPAYMLVALIAIAAIAWYVGDAVRRDHQRGAIERLGHEARLAALDLERQLGEPGASPRALQGRLAQLDSAANLRLTVVRSDGLVLGDSREPYERMDNHAHRPEVAEAFATGSGSSIRYSATRRIDMVYVALKPYAQRPDVVIRAAMPLTDLKQAVWRVYRRIAAGGLVVVLLLVMLSLVIVDRMIRKPLTDLQRGAERFADGRLDQPLGAPEVHETGGLADSLNAMAGQLNERLHAIAAHRNQIDAVLASMADGVLALDHEQRLINANPAAMAILKLDLAQSIGRTIHELVRCTRLHDMVTEAAQAASPVRETLDLSLPAGASGDTASDGPVECHVQVTAAPLHDAERRPIGVVIVVHDLTARHRLELVRRALITNASHELRTPLTAIRGAAETLAGMPGMANDAQPFCGMICRNTERLGQLADDLLEMGCVDELADREQLDTMPVNLRSLAAQAVAAVAEFAEHKRVTVELDVPAGLSLVANEVMLEQTLIELLRNAVAFSEASGTVRVFAERLDNTAHITVSDEGCGIEPLHLPRLFERFYKVDESRQSATGSGAGMGLAIVKHIALAHGGRVWADSAPGSGSTFHLSLPAPSPTPVG